MLRCSPTPRSPGGLLKKTADFELFVPYQLNDKVCLVHVQCKHLIAWIDRWYQRCYTRFDDIPRNAILDNCIDTFIHKTSRYLCAMSNHYAIGRSTGDEREGISWFGLAGRGVRSRRSNRLQLGNWLNGNAINGTDREQKTIQRGPFGIVGWRTGESSSMAF